jgi:hypothetical protein
MAEVEAHSLQASTDFDSSQSEFPLVASTI